VELISLMISCQDDSSKDILGHGGTRCAALRCAVFCSDLLCYPLARSTRSQLHEWTWLRRLLYHTVFPIYINHNEKKNVVMTN